MTSDGKTRSVRKDVDLMAGDHNYKNNQLQHDDDDGLICEGIGPNTKLEVMKRRKLRASLKLPPVQLRQSLCWNQNTWHEALISPME